MTIAAAMTRAMVGSQLESSPRLSRPLCVALSAVLFAVWSALMSARTSAPTPMTIATKTNAIATGARSLKVIAIFFYPWAAAFTALPCMYLESVSIAYNILFTTVTFVTIVTRVTIYSAICSTTIAVSKRTNVITTARSLATPTPQRLAVRMKVTKALERRA